MPDLIKQFLQHAEAKGSKATAVTPAGWITAATIAAFLGALKFSPHPYVLIGLGAAMGAAIINFFASYWYFVLNNPEMLRSEKFTLTKLAIEHSAKGDNVTGIIDRVDLPRLPPPPNGGDAKNG